MKIPSRFQIEWPSLFEFHLFIFNEMANQMSSRSHQLFNRACKRGESIFNIINKMPNCVRVMACSWVPTLSRI